jgi:hypothetical protein
MTITVLKQVFSTASQMTFWSSKFFMYPWSLPTRHPQVSPNIVKCSLEEETDPGLRAMLESR